MFIEVYKNMPMGTYSNTKGFLGGKGWGLVNMATMGVNVPPALIIPTHYCTQYQNDPKKVMALVKSELPKVKEFFNNIFGYMPLVSVRSGAKISMAGMMDTILNVGIDAYTAEALESRLGEKLLPKLYEKYLEMAAYSDNEEEADFLADDQILRSVELVFKSWNNDRAIEYRKINHISENGGTAVIIQAMVFGNLNDNSCTGVLFTRNPDTGEDGVVGEFLPNAQGEDIVSGEVTPQNLQLIAKWNKAVHKELFKQAKALETHFKDMQDIEFTVQDGELFILQTRVGKRSAKAAIKIACEMYEKGVMDYDTAQTYINTENYKKSIEDVLVNPNNIKPMYVGIPASVGVVTGVITTYKEDALSGNYIYLSETTNPEDIAVMNASKAVLTLQGGSTSHAAVVARGMGKTCIVGLGLNDGLNLSTLNGVEVTINGATGEIFKGALEVVKGNSQEVETLIYNHFRKYFKHGQVMGDSVYYLNPFEVLIQSASNLKTLAETIKGSSFKTIIFDVRKKPATGFLEMLSEQALTFKEFILKNLIVKVAEDKEVIVITPENLSIKVDVPITFIKTCTTLEEAILSPDALLDSLKVSDDVLAAYKNLLKKAGIKRTSFNEVKDKDSIISKEAIISHVINVGLPRKDAK